MEGSRAATTSIPSQAQLPKRKLGQIVRMQGALRCTGAQFEDEVIADQMIEELEQLAEKAKITATFWTASKFTPLTTISEPRD